RYLSKYNALLVANGNREQLSVDYDKTLTCYYSHHSQSCFFSALACSSTRCQECHSTCFCGFWVELVWCGSGRGVLEGVCSVCGVGEGGGGSLLCRGRGPGPRSCCGDVYESCSEERGGHVRVDCSGVCRWCGCAWWAVVGVNGVIDVVSEGYDVRLNFKVTLNCERTVDLYRRVESGVRWRLLGLTHVDTESKLGVDGTPVSDPTLYKSLSGALQCLTFTRHDLSYAVQKLYSSSTSSLVAYSDVDVGHVALPLERSTSGYCAYHGTIYKSANQCRGC
ncbi:ribonuclease H-like domain-containing protein, partial [Tanacetum coccineum]